jgi:hypothetical protein
MAFGVSIGKSMKNKKSDDQNRDRNTEKPEQSVFHLIYSKTFFATMYVGRKSDSK